MPAGYLSVRLTAQIFLHLSCKRDEKTISEQRHNEFDITWKTHFRNIECESSSEQRDGERKKSAQEKAAFWNVFAAIHHIRAHMNKYEPKTRIRQQVRLWAINTRQCQKFEYKTSYVSHLYMERCTFFPAQFQRHGRFFHSPCLWFVFGVCFFFIHCTQRW